jgi:hypothetical protein
MFDGLAYRYKRRRLQGIRRKLGRDFRINREKAKGDGASYEALDDLSRDEMMDIDLLEDDISQLVTERLRAQVNHHLIPIPPPLVNRWRLKGMLMMRTTLPYCSWCC